MTMRPTAPRTNRKRLTDWLANRPKEARKTVHNASCQRRSRLSGDTPKKQ